MYYYYYWTRKWDRKMGKRKNCYNRGGTSTTLYYRDLSGTYLFLQVNGVMVTQTLVIEMYYLMKCIVRKAEVKQIEKLE